MNVRKTQISETTVNGSPFTMTQFGATSGVKYLKKLQKLLVPVWAEVASSEGHITPDVIKLASDKFDELDEADVRNMICESCSILPANYEIQFAGQYMAIYTLIKEIIMFNYQDVFTQLGLEEI